MSTTQEAGALEPEHTTLDGLLMDSALKCKNMFVHNHH